MSPQEEEYPIEVIEFLKKVDRPLGAFISECGQHASKLYVEEADIFYGTAYYPDTEEGKFRYWTSIPSRDGEELYCLYRYWK